MIVLAGKQRFIELLGNISSPTAFAYIAYGTGTTAENESQTALVTETSRLAAEISIISICAPYDSIRFLAAFSIGASPPAISEIGIFSAAAGGTMFARKLLDEVFTPSANSEAIVIYDFSIRDGGVVQYGASW